MANLDVEVHLVPAVEVAVEVEVFPLKETAMTLETVENFENDVITDLNLKGNKFIEWSNESNFISFTDAEKNHIVNHGLLVDPHQDHFPDLDQGLFFVSS